MFCLTTLNLTKFLTEEAQKLLDNEYPTIMVILCVRTTF
jgi:hypothetical protein